MLPSLHKELAQVLVEGVTPPLGRGLDLGVRPSAFGVRPSAFGRRDP
jgi:hypothetical protein